MVTMSVEYSCVERHLNNAPVIEPNRNKNTKKYPKYYTNEESYFPTGRDYWEFPTHSFPYHNRTPKEEVAEVPEEPECNSQGVHAHNY